MLAAVQDAARRAFGAVAFGHPGQPLRAPASGKAAGTEGWPWFSRTEGWMWGGACRAGGSSLAGAAAAVAQFGALLGFLEAIGVGLDGDDLGVVDEAVDQRDDAGDGGKDLVPLGEAAMVRSVSAVALNRMS